jgi:hypothetical protein
MCSVINLNRIVFVVLFFAFNLNAQSVRPTIGLGYNRQVLFANNGFFNIRSGLELNSLKYIKPEIEINYFLGGFDEFNNINNQGEIIDVFIKSFTILNLGFSPKIIIGKDEDEFYYFQINPKYNYSIINAKGDYLLINQNDISKSIRTIETLKQNKHSIGIGAGIVFDFSKDKKSDSIAISLMYQNIDAGSLISKLKYNNEAINTKDVFSLTIDYYFNMTKNKFYR